MVNHFSSVVLNSTKQIRNMRVHTYTHTIRIWEKKRHIKTNNRNNSLNLILIWVYIMCYITVHVLQFFNFKNLYPLLLFSLYLVFFLSPSLSHFPFDCLCCFTIHASFYTYLQIVFLFHHFCCHIWWCVETFVHSTIHKWTFENFLTLSCDLSRAFHKINDILRENKWSSSFNMCMERQCINKIYQ